MLVATGQNAADSSHQAVEPEEVYDLCRQRGMDFVTISDHNCIEGALEIAHLPSTFVSPGRSGVIFDAADPEGLICALTDLLADPSAYLWTGVLSTSLTKERDVRLTTQGPCEYPALR